MTEDITYPQEIEIALAAWRSIMADPETLLEYGIEEKYVPDAIRKIVGPILFQKWIISDDLQVTEDEAYELINKIAIDCVIARMKFLGLVDTIENDNGEEMIWATEKGKEAYQMIKNESTENAPSKD